MGTPRSAWWPNCWHTVADRPHLLYVAWGFPPARSGGVYRAWATANEFARQGWRVTVLTAPRETFLMSTGIDESLERAVDPGIEVVRVPFESASYANDIRAWSRWRAHAPELWNGWRGLRERRDFPEAKYGAWRAGLEAATLSIHEKDPVDLVIGTANPHVDFTAGFALHEAAGVPYVMDYRDAWQLDVFSGRRLTGAGSREAKWEKRLIASAHQVWFVNQPILDWHAELHPDAAGRFRVVANGFDLDVALPERDATLPRTSLRFGYIGTISGHVPVRELVAGWRLARQRSALVAASTMELYGYLDHAGTASPAVLKAMDEFEANSITFHGAVSKGDIAAVYSTFDALLLVLGTGRYVTSGKVYEYTATGLPIASIHDPGNAASTVLADYPAWRPSQSLSVEDVASTIVAAAELAALQTDAERAAAANWAERYRRVNQLLPAIADLTATAVRGGGSV